MKKIFVGVFLFFVLIFFPSYAIANQIEQKIQNLQLSLTELKAKLSSLGDKLKEIRLKLDPITTEDSVTVESVALKFVVNLEALKNKYSGANFYEYLNRVGDAKGVTLVRTSDGKAFVLGKCHKPDYEELYNKIKDKEKRPNAHFFTLSPENFGEPDVPMKAVDFMGSQGINPLDPLQIQKLAQMGMAFAQENDVFDENAGNIVVKDGELYYIDKDLTYTHEETMCLNILRNIEASIRIAKYFLPKTSTHADRETVFSNILNAYSKEIKKLDIKIFENLKEDYEKSLDFKDAWNNHIKFENELNSMARRSSDYFGENNAWNAPQTALEKRIVEDVGKIFEKLALK